MKKTKTLANFFVDEYPKKNGYSLFLKIFKKEIKPILNKIGLETKKVVHKPFKPLIFISFNGIKIHDEYFLTLSISSSFFAEEEEITKPEEKVLLNWLKNLFRDKEVFVCDLKKIAVKFDNVFFVFHISFYETY